MDELALLTLDGLQQYARRTAEAPPRVAIYDVIALVKKCDQKYAGQTYLRLLDAGAVPICEEIGQELLHANCVEQAQSHAGGNRKPVRVATASEMLQILTQLPGNREFKKNSADVIVKFLGGDGKLMEHVATNRAAQEQLSRDDPFNLMRIFGEDVEMRATKHHLGEVPANGTCGATMAELVREQCNAAESRFKEFVRKELQRTHPWDFQKHASRQNSLVGIGVVVEGEELTELDSDEHVVRIIDFLKERLSPDTWKKHGNKLKNIFAVELKKHKVEQYETDGHPLFIARNQGEFRIIYTEAEHELMTTVFSKCKRRFSGIVTRDEAFLKSRRKQRRIEDYFTASAPGHDNTGEGQDIIGNHATSAAAGETGVRNAPKSAGAVHSDDRQRIGRRGDTVVMHRDALAEAPASLRVAAKRGDADINITG